VFVVEQNCPYLDEDNKDQASWHFMGWSEDQLVAYVRILPAGLSFKELSIGRVVNSPSVRKKGVGKQLMEKAIEKAWEIYGKQNIRIGAQLYLHNFYESLGFKRVSDIYLEDNIEHIEMVLTA
jgi:ElaA protein